MTVQDFIDGYKASLDKNVYLQKHITTEYVPYFQKVSECNKIVELTMYKTVNDKKIFWVDSPTKGNLFICRIIANYTDIEMGEDVATSFDTLNKNGLISEILQAIPSKEYKEFSTVLQMVTDDLMENTRSFAGYLSSKLDALELLLKTVMDDPEFQETIKNKFQA